MPDEIIINQQPTNEAETTEEIPWQSVLSEIRQAILDGFSSLRNEMESQRIENQNDKRLLMEANTNLTSMITSANQTLMDKVTSLTSNQSTPEIVIQEVQEPTPENVVEENPEALTSQVEESEAVPARRKRRTL